MLDEHEEPSQAEADIEAKREDKIRRCSCVCFNTSLRLRSGEVSVVVKSTFTSTRRTQRFIRVRSRACTSSVLVQDDF